MTFHQLRMARAALLLTVREMAELAGVSHDTLTRLERGETVKEKTAERIKQRLERIGFEFISETGVIMPADLLGDPQDGIEGFLGKGMKVLAEKMRNLPDFQ
jgi:transcriptional regulator with XRE-family HTH domain